MITASEIPWAVVCEKPSSGTHGGNHDDASAGSEQAAEHTGDCPNHDDQQCAGGLCKRKMSCRSMAGYSSEQAYGVIQHPDPNSAQEDGKESSQPCGIHQACGSCPNGCANHTAYRKLDGDRPDYMAVRAIQYGAGQYHNRDYSKGRSVCAVLTHAEQVHHEGTGTVPPPMPSRPLSAPAANPMIMIDMIRSVLMRSRSTVPDCNIFSLIWLVFVLLQ